MAEAVSRMGSPRMAALPSTAVQKPSVRPRMQAKRREREAQEHAPGIAHEDARRVEVETQKGDQRADQAGGDDCHCGFPDPHRNDQEAERGQAGRARRQAIQSIDEIHAVADAHVP